MFDLLERDCVHVVFLSPHCITSISHHISICHNISQALIVTVNVHMRPSATSFSFYIPIYLKEVHRRNRTQMTGKSRASFNISVLLDFIPWSYTPISLAFEDTKILDWIVRSKQSGIIVAPTGIPQRSLSTTFPSSPLLFYLSSRAKVSKASRTALVASSLMPSPTRTSPI